MDRTLKALSLILSYPTRELQAAMPEIGAVLASDTRLTAAARRALRPLVEELRSRDIYELEEQFVMLFDRSRTLSLNLFEHVHGESRDRGGAMVSLLETYRAGGFEPTTSELPDHLPVLLEFLSTRPVAEVRDILADAAHILAALNARLDRRQSPYGAVFAALLQLSGAKADQGPRSPNCWSSPSTTRKTSRRWTRSGKKAKFFSAPTPMPVAHKCATCWRAWIPQSPPRRMPGMRLSSGGSDAQFRLWNIPLYRAVGDDHRHHRPL